MNRRVNQSSQPIASFGRKQSATDAILPLQIERPADLSRFDQLMMLAIATNLVAHFLILDPLRQVVETEQVFARMGVSFDIFFSILVGSLFLMLALWFATSRLCSNSARWILSAHCVMPLFSWIQMLSGTEYASKDSTPQLSMEATIFSAVSTLLGLAAIYFIHTPSARAWFSSR